MKLSQSLRELGLDVLALVWPTECVGCGLADRDCCAQCLAEIRSAAPILRGKMLPGVKSPAFARGTYEGPLRSVLVGYKHGARTGFARHLAPLLRGEILAAMSLREQNRLPLIVAAPSRPARVRERGYRHLEELLRVAFRGRAAPRVLRALRTLKGRTTQVGLKPADRERNAARLAVRRTALKPLRGREVVLFDDVITTGATVRAATAELEKAGARVIAVVALCVVVRRDTRQISRTGDGLPEESRLS